MVKHRIGKSFGSIVREGRAGVRSEAGWEEDDIWSCELAARGKRPRCPIVLPNEAGCLLWQGAKTQAGYGCYDGPVHRMIYRYFVGDIPPEHEVHHTCGTRLCVRPDHLVMLHRERHQRKHSGAFAHNPRWVLSCAKARAIRSELATGELQSTLAARYGVSASTISHVSTLRRWGRACSADEPRS